MEHVCMLSVIVSIMLVVMYRFAVTVNILLVVI